MFGPVEHEIAEEIAKIVNGDRNDVIDDSMEPIDWDRLAHIRQPKIIASADDYAAIERGADLRGTVCATGD